MGYRRRAREQALQLLFSMDLRGEFSEQVKNMFCRVLIPEDERILLFEALVEGVLEHREVLDRTIEQFSSNWRIPRMGRVDRNVLRMAVFEMLYMDDIPDKVSINEAIDLAKKFGTRDSGAFVNGILDSIRKDRESKGGEDPLRIAEP
ncbi:transcription antitermination factor NusB [Desulfobotulus sp. H1]|uniref:Transcription antitermination protein NusB n=1 Tax=Desulfobotulus pelophilus TaxID=2823377 RepID=A0ABT3N7U0_9BACT|nr:transcription antitermination factor NusB [Desulfobotulus pelophilus]MCW7753226.1 transcription antitermination factor NusB [Desulfobotulus pelophilus]